MYEFKKKCLYLPFCFKISCYIKRQEIQQALLSFLKDPRLNLFKYICKSVNSRRQTSCFTLLIGKLFLD